MEDFEYEYKMAEEREEMSLLISLNSGYFREGWVPYSNIVVNPVSGRCSILLKKKK